MDNFESTWNLLANAFGEIFKKNASKLSFEELYRSSYNMVLHRCGDMLYYGVLRLLKQHLERVLLDELVPHLNKFGNLTGIQCF